MGWLSTMSAAVRAAHASTTPAGARLHVVVFSAEQLIRDAVTTALTGMDLAVQGRPVPGTAAALDETRRWVATTRPEIGILVTDLEVPARLHAAVGLVRGIELPWLVLTETAPGPLWGALIEAGAREVLDASSGLAEVGDFIRRTAAGDEPSEPHRAVVLRAWHQLSDERRALTERIARLSVRELEVLTALDEGLTISGIADRDCVAVNTVRGQVASILRKLGVHSQLHAVSALRQEREWLERWGGQSERSPGS
jgi:DNA-binding NarL/FixJ family response regulator